MSQTRRLAAILAADVAGYSRLMGADEEGTLERLKALRRELVDPKIAEHHGRIVKTTGDGMLVEFASVVDAVRCAVEVQQAMPERDTGVAAENRIELRIGINLGDVIVEADDLYGDGVNIAARIEALADAGGVFISNTVHDHVRDRLPFVFEDLGEHQVKNIARPVRVYAFRPNAVADPPALSVLPIPPISEAAATPRLSIVVLPFANLSDDQEQQYFADAITEDLTMDLSRIAGMFVISCNTAFTYRNRPVDTKQIGRELGVRYVLEGSIRRSGRQIRVNTQLIDAATDAHLWADRFYCDASGLFALQDEITGRIAVALGSEIVIAEIAHSIEHPDALDYFLRGRAILLKPASRRNYETAVGLFERALALDPRSVEAQSWLGRALAGRILDELSDSPAADKARAEEVVGQALAASLHSTAAHFAWGQLLRTQGRFDEAILEYETVIALDRNYAHAYAELGRSKLLIGSIEEVIPLQEQAVRLSPRDRGLANWYHRIAMVHLLQSRTDKAIDWLEKARNTNPALPFVHACCASAYALKGTTERAAAELAEARRLSRDDRYSSVARLQALWHFGVPKIRALYETTHFAGLRLAGMPEE